MSLTLRILGAGTPYPKPDQPCSGYLVATPNTRILVDIGLGVWSQLLRYADPGRIDAIWISHLHADHSGDLLAAYQWAANTSNAPRLKVFGPQSWVERVGSMLPDSEGTATIEDLFDTHEHESSPLVNIGDITLTAVPVRHSIPTHGLRLTSGDSTLSYSGDSGPSDALSSLATGADVFLCEAGSASSDNPFHCTPQQAAQTGAPAKRLILTHLAPELTVPDVIATVSHAQIARPGLTIQC